MEFFRNLESLISRIWIFYSEKDQKIPEIPGIGIRILISRKNPEREISEISKSQVSRSRIPSIKKSRISGEKIKPYPRIFGIFRCSGFQSSKFVFYVRALPKNFQKKYTYTDFVQNCPRILKIYLACLSDVSRNGNYF